MPETRKRRPTQLGTCQICGRTVALASRFTPPTIRAHGYLAGDAISIRCLGTDYPPLELDKAHANRVLLWRNAELARLTQEAQAIEEGRAPPAGAKGFEALRRHLDGDDDALQAEARSAALMELRPRILAAQTQVDRLHRLIHTGSIPLTLPTRTPGPRPGDIFRRNRDGRLYTVKHYIPPNKRPPGKRRSVSGAFVCLDPDGRPHRITSNEIARTLRAQGVPLVPLVPDAL